MGNLSKDNRTMALVLSKVNRDGEIRLHSDKRPRRPRSSLRCSYS